jgi:hypothetical protein
VENGFIDEDDDDVATKQKLVALKATREKIKLYMAALKKVLLAEEENDSSGDDDGDDDDAASATVVARASRAAYLAAEKQRDSQRTEEAAAAGGDAMKVLREERNAKKALLAEVEGLRNSEKEVVKAEKEKDIQLLQVLIQVGAITFALANHYLPLLSNTHLALFVLFSFPYLTRPKRMRLCSQRCDASARLS